MINTKISFYTNKWRYGMTAETDNLLLNLKSQLVMKKLIITTILFIFIGLPQLLFAQLDTVHYIPSFFARSEIGDHYLLLSTIETDSFQVTITDGEGNLVDSPYIALGNPFRYDFGRSDTALNIINESQLNSANTEGLKLSAAVSFFANIRHKSDKQALSLTAKGGQALGKRFRSGHLYSTYKVEDKKSHVISIMASQDGTTINISDFALEGVIFHAEPDTNIIAVLNEGESYTVAAYFDEPGADNVNSVNGTLITSNKPVAVNSGSWLGGASKGNGRDIGFDQIVPVEDLGSEYILTKRYGTAFNSQPQNSERPIIVADNDNTLLYFNGDSVPTDSINTGEYYVVPHTFYDTNNIMYILASKNVYVYQTTNSSTSNPNVRR